MEKRWLNLMLTKVKLEYRCRLSQPMDNIDPIENTSGNEDPIINDKNNWSQDDSSSSSNVDFLMDLGTIVGYFVSDYLYATRDGNVDNYSVYFDIFENQICELYKDNFYLSEPEKELFSYCTSNDLNDLNKGSKSENIQYNCDNYDEKTLSSWIHHINRCIESYMRSRIWMDSYLLSGNGNNSLYGFLLSDNDSRSESFDIRKSTNENEIKNDKNLDRSEKYKSLWVLCENCYELNYKRFLKAKMNICEGCGYHLKMNSSDRIELLIDTGTWDPMYEDMVSLDPIEFHSEEEPEEELYTDRIDSYQRETGLTEAIQTGTGLLKGIPVAIGVMDFQFIGGSMGSVVGEKITRLIEYATDKLLPLIIVCASGGARMQEGSLSLMQMAKISSALYHYQVNKKLFYVAILTSPTTGGVTASFAMLGDIIIAEPNAYIAFAGKRVIEETLKVIVPEGSQEAEPLFEKGLFDLMVPRNILKGVLVELFHLHNFFPLKCLPLNKN